MLSLLETTGIQLSSLIAELDENFPPTTPNPSETLSQIMYRSGQRSVVEWIQHRITEENNGS